MSNVTSRFAEIEQYENGSVTDKVIQIKSIYKNGKRSIQPALDSSTGWWAGVERLSDEEKKERKYYVTVGETGERDRLNTTVVLKDGLEFDLNTLRDRTNWGWVKYCPALEMSFESAQKSKCEFYVHIEGRESEKSNKASENVFDAMKCIMEDAATEYPNKALLLGVDLSHEPSATIKEFLLSRAKKNPAEILNLYRNKSMRINLLYVKAKQKGLIKKNNEDGVIKYGVTILGITEDSAIAYLQQNRDILELLDRDVNPNHISREEPKVEDVDLLADAPVTPAKAPAKGAKAPAKK